MSYHLGLVDIGDFDGLGAASPEENLNRDYQVLRSMVLSTAEKMENASSWFTNVEPVNAWGRTLRLDTVPTLDRTMVKIQAGDEGAKARFPATMAGILEKMQEYQNPDSQIVGQYFRSVLVDIAALPKNIGQAVGKVAGTLVREAVSTGAEEIGWKVGGGLLAAGLIYAAWRWL